MRDRVWNCVWKRELFWQKIWKRKTLKCCIFSIQMAAAELFTNETVFPVILDDIFHGKNRDKLMAVFRWLKKTAQTGAAFTNNKDMADIF